jgi:hypothetical protein
MKINSSEKKSLKKNEIKQRQFFEMGKKKVAAKP